MKTVIKLLVVIVIVNAVYRCGATAMKYYQFKDEIEQMVLFSQSLPVGQLTTQILEEAEKRDVPLSADDLDVRREGSKTVADVHYTDQVEVFPRYFYPVTFSFAAEAYGLAGTPGGATRQR